MSLFASSSCQVLRIPMWSGICLRVGHILKYAVQLRWDGSTADKEKYRQLGCTCADCMWFTSSLSWRNVLAGRRWASSFATFYRGPSGKTKTTVWCSWSQHCKDKNGFWRHSSASTQLFLYFASRSFICSLSLRKFCSWWFHNYYWSIYFGL